GQYSVDKLMNEFQLAPVQDMIIEDFTSDGKLDVLIAGNWYVSEIETPRADNGTGWIFENKGNRKFKPVYYPRSGFFASKDVRKLALLQGNKGKTILVANNNDDTQSFIID
ncbi:MAG: hypothetical protein HKN67_08065, partial [Saprospiraceae bacterium]|nr:hypothetical protein [Saprospiraceae bacterium]